MSISVGQYLINASVPKKYQFPPNASPKDIQNKLNEWAKEDPTSYAANINTIKKISDDISTHEGFSIGLEDITPIKSVRDSILNKYGPQFDKADNDIAKKKILSTITSSMISAASKAKGSMAHMVNIGVRGNPAQLIKNIASPVSARDTDGSNYPYLIKKSYSEGLTPSEYWVAGIEARNAVVEGKTAVAEPGDFGKQMFNTLNNMVVTVKDCGTHNGIYLKITDNNILDRYLAKDINNIGKRNTLVTNKIISIAKKNNLQELMVRSPMTCEARNGVCQMCYGLTATGNHHDIGANVGTIAAQSLSEPLTQMKLSTRHGVILAGTGTEEAGMIGVRKLLTKPLIFPAKSTLASQDGVVDRITPAPQGGHYVYLNGVEHYVGTNNTVIVKKGQRVIKGDSLSNGLKDPREFAMLRGLGSGRAYLTNALYNAYNPIDLSTGKRTGIPVDKRHIEVLAKKDLNHVMILEHNGTFSRGDIVDYNSLKSYLAQSTKEVNTEDSVGEYLGKEYMHYTVGTPITENIKQTLLSRGINKVIISTTKIKYEPFITNLRQVPLLKKNFIAQLSHSHLKSTLTQAGALGHKSEIHGYDPIPSFIRGVEFGEGPDGQY